MIEDKLVSVIIPSFNRENTICHSVESVLKQTYKNIEVIVVDDCSTDNTVEKLSTIRDDRLFIYKLDTNSGACIARNFGISKSKGELIAFQDSDDVWRYDKLERQIDYFKNHDLDFLSSGFLRYNGTKKERIGNIVLPKKPVDIWCKLINKNWVSTQTILCKRTCFDKIIFDSEIKRFQDWDLALQAVTVFKIGHLKEELVDVYYQPNSISVNVDTTKSSLVLLEKHKSDIHCKKMRGHWQMSYAEHLVETSCLQAGVLYLKSFFNAPTFKSLINSFLCFTGIKYLMKKRS